MDPGEISSHSSIFEQCRDARQQLLDLISRIDDHAPHKAALLDTMERFMLWAGNLGAMRQPSSKLSVDQRLAKAPEVQGLVCRHLDDIREALDDLSSLLSRGDTPGDDEFRSSDQDAEDDEPFDEAEMILEVIAEAISSLFRLGILVRKATPTDRFKRALQMTDTLFNDAFDIGYVREKYPKIKYSEQDWLSTRLGHLITQRRVFIKYSRDHKVRLQVQDTTSGDLTEQLATQTERQSSKATTFHIDRLPVSVLAPPHEAGPELEEEDADEAMSVMSASTMSNSLSVLRLPSLADLSSDGKPFECPICFTLQHFQREKAWRVHAFRDLKAYVCTAGGASQCNLEYFGDRNTWFEHELRYHRANYTCTLCSGQEPVSRDDFLHHLGAHHPEVSGYQLSAVEDVSRQNPTHFNANDCPFCDDWAYQIRQRVDPKGKRPATVPPFSGDPTLVSATRFKRHVALHQEQLAIFALPRMVEDGERADEDGTDKSIATSQSASTHHSNTSHLSNEDSTWRVARHALATVDAELTNLTAIKPWYSQDHILTLTEITRDLDSLRIDATSIVQGPAGGYRGLMLRTVGRINRLLRREIERLETVVKQLRSKGGQEALDLLKCKHLAAEMGNSSALIKIHILFTGQVQGPEWDESYPGYRYLSEMQSRLKESQDALYDIIKRPYGASIAEAALKTGVDATLDESSAKYSEAREEPTNLSFTGDALETLESELKDQPDLPNLTDKGFGPTKGQVPFYMHDSPGFGDAFCGDPDDSFVQERIATVSPGLFSRLKKDSGGLSSGESKPSIKTLASTEKELIFGDIMDRLFRRRREISQDLPGVREIDEELHHFQTLASTTFDKGELSDKLKLISENLDQLWLVSKQEEEMQKEIERETEARAEDSQGMQEPSQDPAHVASGPESHMAQQLANADDEGSLRSLSPMQGATPHDSELHVEISRFKSASEAAHPQLREIHSSLERFTRTLQSWKQNGQTVEISRLVLDIGTRASGVSEEFNTNLDEFSKALPTLSVETAIQLNAHLDHKVRRLQQLVGDVERLDDRIKALYPEVPASGAPEESQTSSSQFAASEQVPSRIGQSSVPAVVQAEIEEGNNNATSMARGLEPTSATPFLEPDSQHHSPGEHQRDTYPDYNRIFELEVLNGQGAWVALRAKLDTQSQYSLIQEETVRALSLGSSELPRPAIMATKNGILRASRLMNLGIKNPFEGVSQDGKAPTSMVATFYVLSNIPGGVNIYLGGPVLWKFGGSTPFSSQPAKGGSSSQENPITDVSPKINHVGQIYADALGASTPAGPASNALDDIYIIWISPVFPGSRDKRWNATGIHTFCSESLIDSGFAASVDCQVQQLEQPITIYNFPFALESYQATRYVDLEVYGDQEAPGPSVTLRLYLCNRPAPPQVVYLSSEAVELFEKNKVVKCIGYE